MVVRARIHESRAPIVSGQFEDSASQVNNYFLLPLISRSRSFFFPFSSTLFNYLCLPVNALAFS